MRRYVYFFIILIIFSSFSFSQKIIVTHPTGKPFAHGDSMVIIWQTIGITGQVDIILASRSSQHIIQRNVAFNKGKIQYLIPTSVRPGSYFVVIKHRKTVGKSPQFKIIARGIRPPDPTKLPDLIIARLEIIEHYMGELGKTLSKTWVTVDPQQNVLDFHTNASLTFKFTIKNNGAGPCNVRFVVRIQETDTRVEVKKVYSGGLSPGRSVGVTLGPTGIYTKTAGIRVRLGFMVDAGNLVRESDETNNTRGCDFMVGLMGH